MNPQPHTTIDTHTATRPLYCCVCQGTIELGEKYTYVEIRRGAKVSIHVGCKEVKR